jgi:hypothetical protein
MAEFGPFIATSSHVCVASTAHLHSPGKGANKTPPERVVAGLPQVGATASFAAESSSRSSRVSRKGREGAVRSVDGVTGKTDEV